MHAERQPLTRQVLHDGLEVGELGDERRPAVDHQEHVPERIRGGGVVGIVAQLAVGRDGADAVLLERAFPLAQNGFHLGHHAVDPVGFGPGRDATDVRQVLEVHQATAAEVDAVELHVARSVRRGRRQDHRLQERRLAGLRSTADGDVAARRRDVDAPHLLAVPARLVHDAQPESQGLDGGRARRAR